MKSAKSLAEVVDPSPSNQSQSNLSSKDALRVSVLSEALPYIQRFVGRRIVIKYGGAAMAHKDLQEAVFRDIALLSSSSIICSIFSSSKFPLV